MIWDKVTDKRFVRAGSMMLYILFLPSAVLALLCLPLVILFAPLRARQTVRTLDELVNCFWFDGSAYESLSSHAWTAKETWWGKLVIGFTDLIEKGHCEESNAFEQKIVKYVETLMGATK
jgi:hypothetical protein